MDIIKNPYSVYFDIYCLHCNNKICLEQLIGADKCTDNYTDYQKKIVSDCANMKEMVDKFINRN